MTNRRKTPRTRRILHYYAHIVFFGATETRDRERYTCRKRFTLLEKENDTRLDSEWATEAWNAIRYWITVAHQGEGAHVLALERRIIGIYGNDSWVEFYRSSETRDTCQPEPIPERMPGT